MDGKYHCSNGFTGTNGLGGMVKELIITIPENFLGIKTYREFIDENTSGNKFNPKFNKLKGYLLLIKQALSEQYINNIDPVQYIYWLYYKEGIPFNGVNERLKTLVHHYQVLDKTTGQNEEITYTTEGLNDFVVSTFGWIPRECNERTSYIKRMRLGSLDTTGLELASQQKIQDSRQRFTDRLEEVLTNRKNIDNTLENGFSDKKYNALKGKMQQILYIVSLEFSTTPIHAYDIICSLKDAVSDSIIARELNGIIKQYTNGKSKQLVITEDNIKYLTGKFSKVKAEETKQSITHNNDYTSDPDINTEFNLQYNLSLFIGISSIQQVISQEALIKKLNELSTLLDKIYSNKVDPVHYLIYLYYEKEYSVADCSNRMRKIGFVWNASTLGKNIDKLGWKKRKANKPSNRSKKKLSRATKAYYSR